MFTSNQIKLPAMSSSFTTSIRRIALLSCTHRVKIIDRSLTAGMNSGGTIQCSTFSLGGYQYAIIYSPSKLYKIYNYSRAKSYASFHLKLFSDAAFGNKYWKRGTSDTNPRWRIHLYPEGRAEWIL
jgi:hypothetical protein